MSQRTDDQRAAERMGDENLARATKAGPDAGGFLTDLRAALALSDRITEVMNLPGPDGKGLALTGKAYVLLHNIRTDAAKLAAELEQVAKDAGRSETDRLQAIFYRHMRAQSTTFTEDEYDEMVRESMRTAAIDAAQEKGNA